PESRSAYSAANPWSVSRFTVSKVGISRMGGFTSASAAARARDTVGFKPWRLAGATSPRVATGLPASVLTSKDASLGVEVAYVSERAGGPRPGGGAAVNAKTVPPMRLIAEPAIITVPAIAFAEVRVASAAAKRRVRERQACRRCDQTRIAEEVKLGRES